MKFQTPENQRKCILPMNDISETIFYDKRIIISAPIKEPVTWICTKVENTSPKGVNRITFAQDKFDQHKDYIEKDDNGKVVGMWADYWNTGLEPTIPNEDETLTIRGEISYSGLNPQIKIGGSYKKFTIKFYDDETEIDFKSGSWKFSIDGNDASDLITTLTSEASSDVNENQVKVKFIGDNTWLNKILNVAYTSDDGIESNIDIEIIGV